MTPTEQIHLETATLKKQIADLVSAFEARTGAFVKQLVIAPYLTNGVRYYFQDANVQVLIELKPDEEKPKQV